jgi:Tfp pilus assembly protein PilN
MNGVNLIPAKRREAKAQKVRLRKWTLTLAAYLVVLLAGYFLLDRYALGNTQALRSQSKKAITELGRSRQLTQALNHELGQTGKKLQTAQEISGQPDWGTMLAILAQNTTENLVLNSCRMDRAQPVDNAPKAGDAKTGPVELPVVLELGGFAKAQSDVSGYVLRLEKLGLFEKVKLVKTNRELYLNQEAVSFQLQCTLQGTGGSKP